MRLKISENNVYYVHDYIPEYNWNNYDFEDTEISQRILRYKDGKEVAMDFFTKELQKAIVELSNNILGSEVDEIALVAVPPSKVDKYSPIRQSIDTIVDNFNHRQFKREFEYLREMHDFSRLLKRIKDVNTSHLKGNREIYARHITSIECNEEMISNSANIQFVILDDITTTGMIMKVCEDILLDNDVEEENISRLAIAQTKR